MFPQNKVEISEDETIDSGINTPTIRSVKTEIVQNRVTQMDKNLHP